MPGYIVHVGATVLCAHGGQAQPTTPNPRVMVSGQPVTTIAAPYTVAGCPFMTGSNPFPCVTGQWLVGAVRVMAGGTPVVLQSSSSICTPTGTPLSIAVTQVRAKAT